MKPMTQFCGNEEHVLQESFEAKIQSSIELNTSPELTVSQALAPWKPSSMKHGTGSGRLVRLISDNA